MDNNDIVKALEKQTDTLEKLRIEIAEAMKIVAVEQHKTQHIREDVDANAVKLVNAERQITENKNNIKTLMDWRDDFKSVVRKIMAPPLTAVGLSFLVLLILGGIALTG